MEVYATVLPPSFGEEIGSDHMPLPCAMLRRAADFAGSVRDAREMRTRSPVLTAAVDRQKFETHASSALESFRLGVIEASQCTMMTFRFQKGEAQFVWLADAADPDLWRAMDNMTRSRQLAFVFQEQANLWFLPWNVPSSLGQFGIYRREIGRNSVNFLAAAGGAIANASLATHLSSAFPGVDVKYRCVNILMTPHLKRVLDSIPGTATVSPDSAAAVGFASIAPSPGTVQ
jgi:hypothetical protein